MPSYLRLRTRANMEMIQDSQQCKLKLNHRHSNAHAAPGTRTERQELEGIVQGLRARGEPGEGNTNSRNVEVTMIYGNHIIQS